MSEKCQRRKSPYSFDHLVGQSKERRRYFGANCAGGLQIDRERQPRLSTISRLFAPVVDRRRNESSSIPTACAASFVCVFVAIAWQPGRAALSN
jgi:hypothetical protein